MLISRHRSWVFSTARCSWNWTNSSLFLHFRPLSSARSDSRESWPGKFPVSARPPGLDSCAAAPGWPAVLMSPRSLGKDFGLSPPSCSSESRGRALARLAQGSPSSGWHRGAAIAVGMRWARTSLGLGSGTAPRPNGALQGSEGALRRKESPAQDFSCPKALPADALSISGLLLPPAVRRRLPLLREAALLWGLSCSRGSVWQTNDCTNNL